VSGHLEAVAVEGVMTLVFKGLASCAGDHVRQKLEAHLEARLVPGVDRREKRQEGREADEHADEQPARHIRTSSGKRDDAQRQVRRAQRPADSDSI